MKIRIDQEFKSLIPPISKVKERIFLVENQQTIFDVMVKEAK